MCSILNFIRLVLGLLTTVTLGITGYVYINHYSELDCGNMQLAIALGISSILLFSFNILTYMSSCNKFWIVTLCGLFLLGSTGYNYYINENINDECVKKYEEKDIWDYYIYMYIIMLILSGCYVLLSILKICCKNNND